MPAQRALRHRRFLNDPVRFVFCAHNAAVRELLNDHAHGRVFICGEPETLTPGKVLEVFWFGHSGH